MTRDPAKADFAAGRRVECLSVAWTLLEAGVGIAAGIGAASVALIGFGADSVIEVASSAILLWRLNDPVRSTTREKTALRLVGVCFLALAVYVVGESGHSLWVRDMPQVSYLGIIFSGLCLVVMPLLARTKKKIAARLDSRALDADSRQSSICGYLAAILLGGLLLNALFGWWWADPVAALAMTPIIVKEGLEAFKGEGCSCAN